MSSHKVRAFTTAFSLKPAENLLHQEFWNFSRSKSTQNLQLRFQLCRA